MTTKTKISFVPAPCDAEIEEFDRRARLRKFAVRPKRKSKLLPFLPSISLCVRQGRSYQGIVNFLKELHNFSVHRGTVRRFVIKNFSLSKVVST